MDARQEKAIRKIMAKTTDAIFAVLNTSLERLESVTEALEKMGVTEADIEKATEAK